ncbi:MAG: hypothetical protein HY911_04395 [Desulfobacterales bacterium]|nr:hypothetical protein [Desulfobacterales bacterium]
MSLGIMGGSVPAEMTPQGRNLSFMPKLAPGYSPIKSAARAGIIQESVCDRPRSRRRRTRQMRQCQFFGCLDACHNTYCRQHYRIIYQRIICHDWPAGFAYAPIGGGRSMLAALRQKESAGLLAEVEWYRASLRDHAAGLMDICKYRRKEQACV